MADVIPKIDQEHIDDVLVQPPGHDNWNRIYLKEDVQTLYINAYSPKTGDPCQHSSKYAVYPNKNQTKLAAQLRKILEPHTSVDVLEDLNY